MKSIIGYPTRGGSAYTQKSRKGWLKTPICVLLSIKLNFYWQSIALFIYATVADVFTSTFIVHSEPLHAQASNVEK